MKFADLKKNGFDWKLVLDFCKKHLRYISAAGIVVIMVIVLAVGAANSGDKGGKDSQNQQPQDQTTVSEAFAVDTIPEINTLIQNYYTAYVAGDLETLETLATPISDIEKSYISLMSQYITGYSNIHCYTKGGLNTGEYAVSVLMDMGFSGVETMAPGLDFFYVRQNESGAYYIDNLYSQFNLNNQELELDAQIQEFISVYETEADVQELIQQVQTSYDEQLVADENLRAMVETTVPQAIQTWLADLMATVDQNADTGDGQDAAQDQIGDTTDPAADIQIQTVSETIYATSNINIRREPNENAERVGSAVAGQSFTRTGITEDGWSQIDYNGTTAYVRSDYVSTEAPQENTGTGLNYVPEGTEMTLNSALNVRSGMSETASILGTTEPGDSITVILSYQEGWTRVEWGDVTGYILTELLLNN